MKREEILREIQAWSDFLEREDGGYVGPVPDDEAAVEADRLMDVFFNLRSQINTLLWNERYGAGVADEVKAT
jgi:hypothetical protein